MIDYEELAREILCISDEEDYDAVEQAVFDQFDVSLEIFGRIANHLAYFTTVHTSPLTSNKYKGFVKENRFIAKILVP